MYYTKLYSILHGTSYDILHSSDKVFCKNLYKRTLIGIILLTISYLLIAYHTHCPDIKPSIVKTLYIKFDGRFGNVIFQFASAYGLKLSTNRSGIYVVENDQVDRFGLFFPKTKNSINIVKCLPNNLNIVDELGPNKYHKNTEIEIANFITNNVYVHGYLGKIILFILYICQFTLFMN